MKQHLDYWLCKLFYDLQNVPGLGARYRADRGDVLAAYPLDDDVLDALRRDDVAYLSPRTNGFLLRYYFFIAGMPERTFLDRLQAMRRPAAADTAVMEAAHG